MPPKPKARKDARRSTALLGEDVGFLRLPEVLAVFPVAERSWWNGIELGKYPKPVRLSVRTVAWRVADIRRLLAAADENTSLAGPAQERR